MTKFFDCPGCHQRQERLYGEKDGFDILICQNCNTLFAVEKEGAIKFDYDAYYDGNNLAVPNFVSERLNEIIHTFESYRLNNRFLDVGCGAGTLLKVALEASWQAEGTEVSQPSVDFLRGQDIKVFQGELEAAQFPDNSFDVVTAVEILEHIANPINVLKEIHRILRPGGLLWATTPHGRGASARLLGVRWTCVSPPEHLHLLSTKGIRTLLNKAGFQQTKILTQGMNPFEIFHTLRESKKNKRAVVEGAKNSPDEQVFNRVETSYALNESLSKNALRQSIKKSLNCVLNISRLGDSLKIWAIK